MPLVSPARLARIARVEVRNAPRRLTTGEPIALAALVDACGNLVDNHLIAAGATERDALLWLIDQAEGKVPVSAWPRIRALIVGRANLYRVRDSEPEQLQS